MNGIPCAIDLHTGRMPYKKKRASGRSVRWGKARSGGWPSAGKWTQGERQCCAAWAGSASLGASSQDVLHLVFQVQFLFFQGDFFDVFGVGEVGAFRVVVKPFVEIVVPGGELAELLVALQEFPLHFFEVCLHLRPPLRLSIPVDHRGTVAQEPGAFKFMVSGHSTSWIEPQNQAIFLRIFVVLAVRVSVTVKPRPS